WTSSRPGIDGHALRHLRDFGGDPILGNQLEIHTLARAFFQGDARRVAGVMDPEVVALPHALLDLFPGRDVVIARSQRAELESSGRRPLKIEEILCWRGPSQQECSILVDIR